MNNVIDYYERMRAHRIWGGSVLHLEGAYPKDEARRQAWNDLLFCKRGDLPTVMPWNAAAEMLRETRHAS